MALRLAGVPNYGATSVRLQDHTLYQSPEATKIAMNFQTVHYNVGFNLDKQGKQAWNTMVDNIYTSLMTFMSYSAQQAFTRDNLATYLSYVYMARSAIVEAMRDFSITKWRDNYAMSGIADMWGTYSLNLSTFSQNLIALNSAAATIATDLPAPSCVTWDNIEYLLANVFSDDNQARKNYIVFHMWNTTQGANADYKAALDKALQLVTAANDPVHYGNNANAVPTIRGLIAKVYGPTAFTSYPIATESLNRTPVYDSELLTSLANMITTATFDDTDAAVTAYGGIAYDIPDICSCVDADHMPFRPITSWWKLPNVASTHAVYMHIALPHTKYKIHGPVLEGEGLAKKLYFVETTHYYNDNNDLWTTNQTWSTAAAPYASVRRYSSFDPATFPGESETSRCFVTSPCSVHGLFLWEPRVFISHFINDSFQINSVVPQWFKTNTLISGDGQTDNALQSFNVYAGLNAFCGFRILTEVDAGRAIVTLPCAKAMNQTVDSLYTTEVGEDVDEWATIDLDQVVAIQSGYAKAYLALDQGEVITNFVSDRNKIEATVSGAKPMAMDSSKARGAKSKRDFAIDDLFDPGKGDKRYGKGKKKQRNKR